MNVAGSTFANNTRLPDYGTSDWDHEVFEDWLYIPIGYDIAPKPKKGG